MKINAIQLSHPDDETTVVFAVGPMKLLRWVACRIGLHPLQGEGWQNCPRCDRRFYQPSDTYYDPYEEVR